MDRDARARVLAEDQGLTWDELRPTEKDVHRRAAERQIEEIARHGKRPEPLTDGEVLDKLARVFKAAGEDDGVNGGDLVDLVGELLPRTGRSLTYTLATPRNMGQFEDENPPLTDSVERLRCIAWSPLTGEEFSGDEGDYFSLGRDEALTDSDGQPMILVLGYKARCDAITGEAI